MAGKYFGFNTFSKTKYIFYIGNSKTLSAAYLPILFHQSKSDRCLFSSSFFFLLVAESTLATDLLAASSICDLGLGSSGWLVVFFK